MNNRYWKKTTHNEPSRVYPATDDPLDAIRADLRARKSDARRSIIIETGFIVLIVGVLLGIYALALRLAT